MLNPTEGYVIPGAQLDNWRFVGRLSSAQLLKMTDDPRLTEDRRQRTGNRQLENLYRIRQEVQRLFEGAKRKNVIPYAAYIIAVHEGQDGMIPPLILYCEQELPIRQNSDGTGILQIPWEAQLVAIDGETQLAARFEAGDLKPETKTDFVPVVICHGRSLEWARQVFHDLNLLAVRPNAAVGIGMDQRDVMTGVARAVEQQVAFFTGRVSKVRRQLRRRDPEVVTITVLRGACVTLAEGIAGVKYGSRPVPVAADHIGKIRKAALIWFNAIATELGSDFENREQTILSTPSVMAALGAVGNPLVGLSDSADHEVECQRLMGSIRDVNWTRGNQWHGIAGKVTARKRLAVGGTKETAYAIHAALTDPKGPGFRAVRGITSTAA